MKRKLVIVSQRLCTHLDFEQLLLEGFSDLHFTRSVAAAQVLLRPPNATLTAVLLENDYMGFKWQDDALIRGLRSTGFQGLVVCLSQFTVVQEAMLRAGCDLATYSPQEAIEALLRDGGLGLTY